MTVELPLAQMSLEEKLHALDLLWSDLCRHEKNIPVPQWHRDLLDKRARLTREGKAKFSSWESAKKRISARAREN
jgi:hypothetical protein